MDLRFGGDASMACRWYRVASTAYGEAVSTRPTPSGQVDQHAIAATLSPTARRCGEGSKKEGHRQKRRAASAAPRGRRGPRRRPRRRPSNTTSARRPRRALWYRSEARGRSQKRGARPAGCRRARRPFHSMSFPSNGPHPALVEVSARRPRISLKRPPARARPAAAASPSRPSPSRRPRRSPRRRAFPLLKRPGRGAGPRSLARTAHQ